MTAPDPRPEPPPEAPSDAQRVAVAIAMRLTFLAVFAYLALTLIRPFAALGLWTVVLAAALHPAYRWLAARLGGRPRIAAALVTLAAFLIAVGPIAMLGVSLIETARALAVDARSGALQLPDPPRALIDLPVAGATIADNWNLAATNVEGFIARYSHLLLGASEVAARPALRFGENMLTLLAAILLSGFLHLPGGRLAEALRIAATRVAGERGAVFVAIATATIRNVARGVIGVAVIQALLIGLGLILGGVPAAGLLTLAALILAIVQIGAWPVVLPVIAWAWFERGAGPALLLAAYLAPAGLIDIVLKPFFLAGSNATPALVIFAGVLGGTLSYGLIGLFLGPILLAIAYELLRYGLYGEDRRSGVA